MSSSAYITAGLAVQNTRTPEPSAMAAFLSAGLQADDLPHAGYEICMGTGPVEANIDEDNPVALVPQGINSLDLVDVADNLGIESDTDYLLAVRAVSESDVDSELSNAQRIRIESDTLLGQKPNPLSSATAEAVSGGEVAVRVQYNTIDEPAAATQVKVARYDLTTKAYDFASPEATLTVSGSGNIKLSDTIGPYTHGDTVKLAARAVTAAGVAGDATAITPVVADTTGPAVVDSMTATQYD